MKSVHYKRNLALLRYGATHNYTVKPLSFLSYSYSFQVIFSFCFRQVSPGKQLCENDLLVNGLSSIKTLITEYQSSLSFLFLLLRRLENAKTVTEIN